MAAPLCKLTLAVPRKATQSVLDVLEHRDPPLTGLTIIEGEGRSSGLTPSSGAEKVRGAVAVTLLIVIVPEALVEGVLTLIKEECPAPHLAFWTEPVSDYGVLV